MTRVLLAVDGSELDDVIALAARKLFGADAEYLAVNVSEPEAQFAPNLPYGMVYPYVWDKPVSPTVEVETAFDEAERVAERVGQSAAISVEPIGDVGDPADAIVSAAAEHAADVIVVGSRERSWFARLIDPSVSREVTASSPVPVLIVRAPA